MKNRRVRRIVCCQTCRTRFTTTSGSKLCLSCRPSEEAVLPTPELPSNEQMIMSATTCDSNMNTRQINSNDNFPMDGENKILEQQTHLSKSSEAEVVPNQLLEVISIDGSESQEGDGDGIAGNENALSCSSNRSFDQFDDKSQNDDAVSIGSSSSSSSALTRIPSPSKGIGAFSHQKNIISETILETSQLSVVPWSSELGDSLETKKKSSLEDCIKCDENGIGQEQKGDGDGITDKECKLRCSSSNRSFDHLDDKSQYDDAVPSGSSSSFTSASTGIASPREGSSVGDDQIIFSASIQQTSMSVEPPSSEVEVSLEAKTVSSEEYCIICEEGGKGTQEPKDADDDGFRRNSLSILQIKSEIQLDVPRAIEKDSIEAKTVQEGGSTCSLSPSADKGACIVWDELSGGVLLKAKHEPSVSSSENCIVWDEKAMELPQTTDDDDIVCGSLSSNLSGVIQSFPDDDNSSISSFDSLFLTEGKPLCTSKQRKEEITTTLAAPFEIVEGQKLQSNKNVVTQYSDDDNSTAASDDSIWDKKGFDSKQEEKGSAAVVVEQQRPRIETYYDYLQLQNKKADASNCERSMCEISEGAPKKEGAIFLGKESNCAGDEKSSNNGCTNHDASESSLPPEVPLPTNATWHIVLLMDHREFGCANDYLQTVEKKINNHFGRNGKKNGKEEEHKHAEITTLASADYLYVARLISSTTGEIMEERVLDMVIERKAVQDACQCLIADSKKYKPLSFFEAQMYKLQHSGMTHKIFLMEGDEHKTRNMFKGCKSQKERDIRLKRVKTLRMQLANGEFNGVNLICTRGRGDTVKYLIHQLELFRQNFNPRRPPTKTREELKNYINEQMKAPTFLEYLRLRSIPGIGDVKAMKVIMDPTFDWDKSFLSPSSSKRSKATLEDRATFWKAPTRRSSNSVSNIEKLSKPRSNGDMTSKPSDGDGQNNRQEMILMSSSASRGVLGKKIKASERSQDIISNTAKILETWLNGESVDGKENIAVKDSVVIID
eukprot:CAMPEP_0183717988 /NCGR_PEP_ID=MMETSP0737-20130205/11377_1 /TAXON_ID=385413 /ORGANISM="Thalassiosira miniscula, Strain CCMP1093" /LENGTH=1003 /DNA_ID=CAMNT_0025947467 /DNA_START=197 /DNA_END=3205 /DNA_ORIENTATION=+